MTPKSIRSHLAPYSILSKRRTTIAHAFASALAPCDQYDEKLVHAALAALGQKNLKELTCIYCGSLAQTWDHLENLVKNGKLNGYGHQVGNLVPCCRECNSKKGGKSFQTFIQEFCEISPEEKKSLLTKLETHLTLAKRLNMETLDEESEQALQAFNNIQAEIARLMGEADKHASILRRKRIS